MENEVMEMKEHRVLTSKKDTILALYGAGIKEIESIAAISGAKPSYVGSVLQKEGLIDNYFDLYTSTAQPMNIYSKFFRGKLGFKDVETAERSVEYLEHGYSLFGGRADRAGQHHCLDMALTMLDRARWTNKLAEAEVYRQWLVGKLSKPLVEQARPAAVAVPDRAAEEENGTERFEEKRAA